MADFLSWSLMGALAILAADRLVRFVKCQKRGHDWRIDSNAGLRCRRCGSFPSW